MDVFGVEELGLKDLYLINEKFLNTISCQCEFSLSDISISASIRVLQNTLKKAKGRFNDFLAIVNNIESNGKLNIDLYGLNDTQTIYLNEHLVNQKQAKFI